MRTRGEFSLASTKSRRGVFFRGTGSSARGECDKGGWLPRDSEVLFSRWFLDGMVSGSKISVG